MPVTIRVGTTAGDVVHQAQIRQRVDTIVVDSVMSAPTMVVFDDGNRILKSLNFDQPTEWLTTQLQRDSDLWNREWVIGQLARRPADTGAGAAVANAATSADYFETRVAAASALAAFPAEVALPALTHAIADTSAQVRAAAAATLGDFAGPRSIELARAAWRDTSYEVRAAALGSLARLDSAGRHALLLEGISTPSYRDAIQSSALIAIARSNDTSLIADVQRVVGDQMLASRVLGAFAARGNQQALDLLSANLDDARDWVRGWSLAGMGALPPARRLTVLQGLEPKLTHADTRASVQRAITLLSAARR